MDDAEQLLTLVATFGSTTAFVLSAFTQQATFGASVVLPIWLLGIAPFEFTSVDELQRFQYIPFNALLASLAGFYLSHGLRFGSFITDSRKTHLKHSVSYVTVVVAATIFSAIFTARLFFAADAYHTNYVIGLIVALFLVCIGLAGLLVLPTDTDERLSGRSATSFISDPTTGIYLIVVLLTLTGSALGLAFAKTNFLRYFAAGGCGLVLALAPVIVETLFYMESNPVHIAIPSTDRRWKGLATSDQLEDTFGKRGGSGGIPTSRRILDIIRLTILGGTICALYVIGVWSFTENMAVFELPYTSLYYIVLWSALGLGLVLDAVWYVKGIYLGEYKHLRRDRKRRNDDNLSVPLIDESSAHLQMMPAMRRRRLPPIEVSSKSNNDDFKISFSMT